jgi:peptidoglycan/xylan/chitin deacetylase (PgdA/CDA1 family)
VVAPVSSCHSSLVTVLCYHSISCGWDNAVSVEAADFEKHCALLSRRGRVVPLSAVADRLAVGSAPPRGLDVLTFDDGFADFAEVAVPILRRYRLPATMYIVAGSITEAGVPVNWVTGVEAEDAPPLLTVDQIRELHAEGFGFGSHSMSHRDLPTLTEAECVADLRESRELLCDLLGEKVTSLAYPFGRHSPHVRSAAEKAGYAFALALPDSAERAGRFAADRTGIYRGNGGLRFRIKTSPVFPALRSAPGYLPATTAVKRALRAVRPA